MTFPVSTGVLNAKKIEDLAPSPRSLATWKMGKNWISIVTDGGSFEWQRLEDRFSLDNWSHSGKFLIS